jgi:hypothetical protein
VTGAGIAAARLSPHASGWSYSKALPLPCLRWALILAFASVSGRT